MKITIILIFLSISSAFSQVDCSEQDQTFTGKCEAYNSTLGIRSKYSYRKGTLHGKFEESFENGQQRSVGRYKSGLLNGKFSSFYVTGEKLTEAKFKSGTGSFIMYYANGVDKVKGQFEEGKAIGKWNFFDVNGNLSRESEGKSLGIGMYDFLVGEKSFQKKIVFDDFFESFDGSGFSFSFGDDSDSMMTRMQGQMNESIQRIQLQMEDMMQRFSDTSFTRSFQFDTTFSSNGFENFDNFFDFKSFGDSSFSQSFYFDTVIGEILQQLNPFFHSPDRDLVDFPDTEPSYIGGEEAMKIFIQREMHVLEEKKEASKKGIVFIDAIVEKDGSISNSRVALGIDNLRDTEALRIINSMPLWKPALFDNQVVRSRCIIPVEFDLE